jgi:hypothetical protein
MFPGPVVSTAGGEQLGAAASSGQTPVSEGVQPPATGMLKMMRVPWPEML